MFLYFLIIVCIGISWYRMHGLGKKIGRVFDKLEAGGYILEANILRGVLLVVMLPLMLHLLLSSIAFPLKLAVFPRCLVGHSLPVRGLRCLVLNHGPDSLVTQGATQTAAPQQMAYGPTSIDAQKPYDYRTSIFDQGARELRQPQQGGR